jgi:hypothetical protein
MIPRFPVAYLTAGIHAASSFKGTRRLLEPGSEAAPRRYRAAQRVRPPCPSPLTPRACLPPWRDRAN